MTDHLSRAAAAIDWRDETEDELGRPADRARPHTPDAPPIGDTEFVASLRCPVGRVRAQPGDTADQAEPRPEAKGRVTAFPTGEANRAIRSIPMDKARATPLDLGRTRKPFAGRGRGITENTS